MRLAAATAGSFAPMAGRGPLRADSVAQRLAGRVVRCQCTRGELGIGVGAQARPAGVSGLRRRIRVAGHDRRGAGALTVPGSPGWRRAGGHALFMRLGEDLDPREQERGDHQPHDEASELHGPTFFSVARTTPASRLNDGRTSEVLERVVDADVAGGRHEARCRKHVPAAHGAATAPALRAREGRRR